VSQSVTLDGVFEDPSGAEGSRLSERGLVISATGPGRGCQGPPRRDLRGAFLPAPAAARHWIGAGEGGAITMTSSIAGSVNTRELAPYVTSKGGINELVRTLAVE
jgi:NAD(P)-dependent dehydrogenase (short-subunit alcohol dehydrogenase family)